MGGLWKPGVKSFKQHFKKVAYPFKYSFEEFSTLLSNIEACFNSRPICTISEDPADFTALTPGHFPNSCPLLAPAIPEVQDPPLLLLNRWQRLKALHERFCSRWKREYLHELHKRYKWNTPSDNIQVGMIMVIHEDNLPRTEWRLGRIQTVILGPDGLAQVADILPARGVIRRQVSRSSY